MIGRVLRLAGLALCVLLLWRAVDWAEAGRLLRAADPLWLAGAALLLTLQTALSAERWRITAAQLGLGFGFGHALREYYLSQVINQSLPGGVLGDAGRAVRSREQAGLRVAGKAVIFERLAGQLGLLTLLLGGLSLGLLIPALQTWPSWFVRMSAAILSLSAVACLCAFTFLRWPGAPLSALRRTVAGFGHAVAGPTVWRRQLGLSLATAACNVTAFAFCAAAIGTVLAPLAVITLIPLVLFAMVLPLSIGGWGLREGAAVVLFPAFGASGDAGFAASVAFGLMILLSVLPGLVLGWTGKGDPSQTR